MTELKRKPKDYSALMSFWQMVAKEFNRVMKRITQIQNNVEKKLYSLNNYIGISSQRVKKSRKENPQKPTQLSSRSHPRHLVGKKTWMWQTEAIFV